MSDNPLDRIPSHDRVSLRAVVVGVGEDPGAALAAAGIVDPIVLPIVFGEGAPDASFGDAFTPNLTAVLEPDQGEDDGGSPHGGQGFGMGAYDPAGGSDGSGTARAGSAGAATPASEPTTTTLPAAYGLQPLAPVRRPGQSG